MVKFLCTPISHSRQHPRFPCCGDFCGAAPAVSLCQMFHCRSRVVLTISVWPRAPRSSRVSLMFSVKCASTAFALFLVSFSFAIAQSSKARSLQPQPIGTTTRAQERWADRTLKRLTLEEKIGQMIEVRGIMGYYNSEDPAFQQLITDIRKYHLGAVHLSVNTDGPLLLRTEPYEAAMTTNLVQQESHSKVPLIFSVDF